MVKKLWRYVKPFSSNTGTLRTDGRTDRQTDRFAISISRASTLTRDKNDMHTQLSLSLHFYLFFVCFEIAAVERTRNVFVGRLLVALKTAGCVVCWLWKVPILVQQMFKAMSFCLHAFTQPLSPLTNSFDVLRYAYPYVIEALVSRTCVLYNVHTFLHQSPNSVVDRVSWSTRLFGG